MPPTARSRPGPPVRAISDTRSCWPRSLDMNQICGMIAGLARSFQARTVSLCRAAGERGLGHAACRHVRACRLIEYDPDPRGRVSAKRKPVFPRDKREAFARRSCPTIEARKAARLRRSGGDAWGGCGVFDAATVRFKKSDLKSPRPVF